MIKKILETLVLVILDMLVKNKLSRADEVLVNDVKQRLTGNNNG